MSLRGWKIEEIINCFFSEQLVGVRSNLVGVELIRCPDLYSSGSWFWVFMVSGCCILVEWLAGGSVHMNSEMNL